MPQALAGQVRQLCVGGQRLDQVRVTIISSSRSSLSSLVERKNAPRIGMSPSQGNLSTLLTELLLVSPLITKLAVGQHHAGVGAPDAQCRHRHPPLWMPAL